MATKELLLLVKAVDDASRTLGTIGGSVEDLGDETQGTDDQLSGMSSTAKMLGGVLAGALTVQTVKAAYEFGKLGAESLRTKANFEAISGGSRAAAANLDAMRKATRRAMSEQDMMTAANQMLQMGLVNTSDELEEVSEMATRLGSAMGHEAGEALEGFTLMLANQSIPRLDTYGISASNVRLEMAELAEEFPHLSKETRFMTATMSQGRRALERLGPAIEDDMLAAEQLEASMADLKVMAAEMLAPAMAKVAKGLLEVTTQIQDQARDLDDFTDAHGKAAVGILVLEHGMWETEEAAEAYQLMMEKAERNTAAANLIVERGTPLMDGWASSLTAAADEAEDLTEIVNDYSAEMDLLASAIEGPVKKANEDYLDQLQELNEEVAAGEAELAGLESRHGKVYGSQVDLTQAQVGAELATRKLAQAQAKLAENTDPEKQLRFEEAVWRAENALTRQNESVTGASGGITNYSEDILGVEQDLADWRAELAELDEQHAESINRILYDIMLARLAVDGWTQDELRLATETAKGMGIIDQETYDATIAMDGHLARFAAGVGVRETRLAIMGTAEDLLDLGPVAETAGITIPIGLQKSQHAFDNIDEWAKDSARWIRRIPRNIDITTNYHTTGVPPGGTPGGHEQYQHGTDYVPYTGFAYLHEGEAVLTKEENRQRTRGEGAPIHVVNNFGRDSVRSDEDIRYIIDSIQTSIELQGLRSRIA